MKLKKTVRLLSLLPSRPLEFADRVRAVIEVHYDARRRNGAPYEPVPIERMISDLAACEGVNLQPFREEAHLHAIRKEVSRRMAGLSEDTGFALCHNMDFALSELSYLVCRACRPTTVIETGVAYGVGSAFILKALAVNSHGHLHSIDLPPLARCADEQVGRLIPPEIRERWTLYRGTSRRLLPHLLCHLHQVDVFIHDSLHTYWNMKYEFELVQRHLAPDGFLLSDDIQDNSAFCEFIQNSTPAYAAVACETGELNRHVLMGMAYRPAMPPRRPAAA